MKIILVFFLFFLPIYIQAQIVKDVSIDGKTVKVYRLDEKQKKSLSQAKYTKDKKRNTALIQEILDNYLKLESALDSGNSKEAQEPLKNIDFRLGSDAPNIKYLREEYNIYASGNITKQNREARKQYIDSIKANSKEVF